MSETESFSKRRDSFLAGVSVRGVMAVMLCATVCAATFLKYELKSLDMIVVLVFSYYYPRTETKS